MNVDVVKANAVLTANRTKLLVDKHSPEILLALGIVGVVSSTVMACKATLKAPAILDEARDNFSKIDLALETIDNPEIYNEEDYRKDKVIASAQFLMKMLEIYGPAIVVGVISIGMLVGSNRILSRRNAAILSAYKLIDESFKQYRKRVVDELGPDVDKYFRFKKKTDKPLRIVDKKGKEVDFDEMEVDLPGELVDDADEQYPSVYARYFDSSSTQWRKDHSTNQFFLKSQQNYANDLLRVRGHVFLNEVYDSLGIPRSQAGAVVGWVKGHGDDFIDFDIYNPVNEENVDYINGYNQAAILLDFNVDGVIYDMI